METEGANTKFSQSVWTLILAAGSSSRFGGIKALAAWESGTFLSQALKTANQFSGPNTLVVTGAYDDKISACLRGTSHVFNKNWKTGMGASLQCGIQEILTRDASVEFLAILPVDQPFVEVTFLQRLLNEARKLQHCVFTAGDQFVGPPAIIPRSFLGRAENLKGEQGFKSLLSPNEWTSITNLKAAKDIDSPADY